MLTLDWLADDLRRTVFSAHRQGPPRIGAELELIPVGAASRRIVPIAGEAGTLRVLYDLARQHGWDVAGSAEAPMFRLPGGGTITYEPGGQIEYSSPPFPSPSALIANLASVVSTLRDPFAAAGVELLGVGIDPETPPAEAPLQLRTDRYLRMDDYFGRLGPAGARMMRQTAAFQVAVELGPDPMARWRLLNAIAPEVIALFANSSRYAGQETGYASYRAAAWRSLDSSRTGVLNTAPPVASYLEFALAAPDMMRRTDDGRYRSFCGWLMRGEATEAQWRTHLSTLFPEVRPRGYFEVRSADAMAVEDVAAPIVLLWGLLSDPATERTALEVAGQPSAERLVRAGECGLGDGEVRRRAEELVNLALRAAERMVPDQLRRQDLERAGEYFGRVIAGVGTGRYI
ncbi:MAG TPA: glutamate-cysteine ligase family protein [Gemmatimonadales bacterium]|nr:glutamate-cysteine ligase family protein [Gemmatimonadales bacterium]